MRWFSSGAAIGDDGPASLTPVQEALRHDARRWHVAASPLQRRVSGSLALGGLSHG
jgi:hypothetical protein